MQQVHGYHMIVTIRESIASIYKVLRDICAYIMLAGLIYTGIRVLITSNNPQKQSQWKALVFDWFVGMILLIFSHVLLVGIFYISDLIVDNLATELNGFGGMNFTLVIQCLMSWDSAEQIICMIMLIYLMYMTIVFLIAYFKRFMWICILIVIAPVVSVMYSFGNQTKQIYTKWLREYIMTVFVQPFHLVVYYILVSIPLNIANDTGISAIPTLDHASLLELIYALVAMSFIRPAEKYIRELFGFHQGIANLASFDSGKQTLDEIRRFVQKQKERVANMGKQALTVVGAAVGTYFGGPMGGKLGAKLGNTVGSIGEKQVKKSGQRAEKLSNTIDSRSSSTKGKRRKWWTRIRRRKCKTRPNYQYGY